MKKTLEPGSSFRYCGRAFSREEITWIRDLIATESRRNRAQLSRLVSKELGWLRPDGRPKDMACRVAMLRMQRDGLITLPPPQKGNGNGRTDRKSTRLNSSHLVISYAVFCLKKKIYQQQIHLEWQERRD